MPQLTTIKRSLLLHFLVIILVLSSTITAITFFSNQQVIRQLSSALMTQAIEHTESKLRGYFRPVTGELLLAQDWGKSGILEIEKPEKLRQLFTPVLRQYPQISSVLVADTRGREFMLIKSGNTWINRLTRKDDWQSKVRWQQWQENEVAAPYEWRDMDYDPRLRPWFIGALSEYDKQKNLANLGLESARAQVHWTQPYAFYTSKQPGITASIYFTPKDNITHVVGLDVLLTDISKFTTSLSLTNNGKVVVLTDDTRVIGLAKSERYNNEGAIRADLLKRPTELSDPLVANALRARAKRKKNHDAKNDRSTDNNAMQGAVRFKSNAQDWVADFREFKLSENRSLLIAALIPESDLTGNLKSLRVWIAVVTLTTIAIAMYFGLLLSRRFSKPIEVLVKQSERISRGVLYEGKSIVSSFSEVQRLADSHEKMRIALTSLLKLENDLHVARQVQQSTLPKNTPIINGVSIAAWSEPAESTGGDTYDIIAFSRSATGEQIITNTNPEFAVFLLADATGHGIGPALSAAEVRAMLRMAIRAGESLPDIVKHMNEQLCMDLHGGRFITAWLGLLDTANYTLTCFSAGQAPILVYRAAQQEFLIIDADAPPLGITSEFEIVMPEVITLHSGDMLLVASDGVYEAAGLLNSKNGVERIIEVLRSNKHKDSPGIMNAIRQTLQQVGAEAPAKDDKTALLIKRG